MNPEIIFKQWFGRLWRRVHYAPVRHYTVFCPCCMPTGAKLGPRRVPEWKQPNQVSLSEKRVPSVPDARLLIGECDRCKVVLWACPDDDLSLLVHACEEEWAHVRGMMSSHRGFEPVMLLEQLDDHEDGFKTRPGEHPLRAAARVMAHVEQIDAARLRQFKAGAMPSMLSEDEIRDLAAKRVAKAAEAMMVPAELLGEQPSAYNLSSGLTSSSSSPKPTHVFGIERAASPTAYIDVDLDGGAIRSISKQEFRDRSAREPAVGLSAATKHAIAMAVMTGRKNFKSGNHKEQAKSTIRRWPERSGYRCACCRSIAREDSTSGDWGCGECGFSVSNEAGRLEFFTRDADHPHAVSVIGGAGGCGSEMPIDVEAPLLFTHDPTKPILRNVVGTPANPKPSISQWPLAGKFHCRQCSDPARVNPLNPKEWGCAKCNGSSCTIALNFAPDDGIEPPAMKAASVGFKPETVRNGETLTVHGDWTTIGDPTIRPEHREAIGKMLDDSNEAGGDCIVPENFEVTIIPTEIEWTCCKCGAPTSDVIVLDNKVLCAACLNAAMPTAGGD